MLQIPFEVAEDAADGNRNLLRISEVQAADAEGNSINLRPSGGGITVSEEGSLPGEGENELVFAQVANGTFAGGIFGVTLIFVNRTDASAMAEIRFFKSDGTPFVVTLTNGQSDSTFVFGVPAGGSVFLQTDGTGEVSAGYARLTSTGPLGGTLLFALEDGGGKCDR